jgi:hypothetical protein
MARQGQSQINIGKRGFMNKREKHRERNNRLTMTAI